MRNRLSELLMLTKAARQQSISMKRKLMLYWGMMALVVFALFLVILSFAGVFSNPARKLEQVLEMQLSNTYADMTGHFDTLAAQCIRLSEQASTEIEEALGYGVSIKTLNDRPDQLVELQQSLYPPLNTTLQVGPCSGAFLILDATVNTAAEGAEHSRSGLYLRYACLNAASPVNQHVACFRGSSGIARAEGLELHNRWNLEFDVDAIPGYRETMNQSVSRLADAYFWTGRVHLQDTWEDAMLLCVPIVNSDGSVCGLCGVELSSLYFQLTYPAPESEFGHMIVALGSLDDDIFSLSGGVLGGQDGTHLDTAQELQIRREPYFYTYTAQGEGSYIGLHRRLPCATQDGGELTLAVLVPEQSYRSAAALNRIVWIGGSLAFLLAMLALALFFSRRFVGPIVQSLEAVQKNTSFTEHGSGISEIDVLLQFIHSREKNRSLNGNGLPPDIAELFNSFSERVQSLTTAEKTILKYYVEGYETADIPEKAFISISTVRKHNSNIYRKLGVASREELMLYIELFRRCERLDELE